jgi:hypothetical protein
MKYLHAYLTHDEVKLNHHEFYDLYNECIELTCSDKIHMINGDIHYFWTYEKTVIKGRGVRFEPASQMLFDSIYISGVQEAKKREQKRREREAEKRFAERVSYSYCREAGLNIDDNGVVIK